MKKRKNVIKINYILKKRGCFAVGSNNGFINGEGINLAIKSGFTVDFCCGCGGVMESVSINGRNTYEEMCSACNRGADFPDISNRKRITTPETNKFWSRLRKSK